MTVFHDVSDIVHEPFISVLCFTHVGLHSQLFFRASAP